MRVAIAVLAASLAALGASDTSSADDAPVKPDSPKPLRISLAAGKTYVYRFRQTTTHRMTEGRGADGRKQTEGVTEVIWDAGLSLVRKEPNDDIVVALLPERVRGSVQRPGGKAVAFDSESEPTLLTGWVARAELSPQGRVVAAEWVSAVLEPDGPIVFAPTPPAAAPVVLSAPARSVAWGAASFIRLFVHEVGSDRPRIGGSWTARSEMPPEWRIESGTLSCDAFLADDASATFLSVKQDAVAKFSLSGTCDVTRIDKTIDLTAGLSKDTIEDLPFGSLSEQVASWSETGELRLRGDAGLTSLRASEGRIVTHANAVRLPKGFVINFPAPGPWGLPGVPTDHVYEFTTRVELVDVR